MSETTLLVVDDDREIRLLLSEYLEGHGFQVLAAADGDEMNRLLRASPVDLVILDLTLPGVDGLELCRQVRQNSILPVIMLTARAESYDRILGLEMGADDYLAKPFEPRELLARIRSVLRRFTSTQQPQRATRLRFAGWSANLATRQLVNPQGILVSLSGAEFRLLKVFLENPNRVLTREQLMQHTQSRESEHFDRSIDLQVSRLRQKLGEEARTPQLVKTVRSEGYVLACEVRWETGLCS